MLLGGLQKWKSDTEHRDALNLLCLYYNDRDESENLPFHLIKRPRWLDYTRVIFISS